VPSSQHLDRSRLAKAMKEWGASSLEDLHKRSVDSSDWFWRAASKDLGITFTTPYTATVDESLGRLFPSWFPGGRLNLATHCVDRHAASPSLSDAAAVRY